MTTSTLVLLLLCCGLSAVISAVRYECMPPPLKTVCMLERIHYHPGQQPEFPEGYQHFSVINHRRSGNVSVFDEQLFQAMHRPTSVEMHEVKMEKLLLPGELLYGSFADNRIRSLPVNGSITYQISYLDLSGNRLENIANISALLKLESLFLANNRIKEIGPNVLSPLISLKRLVLHSNYLEEFPWESVSPTIEHLDLSDSHLADFSLRNISLPLLESLDLANNMITHFNVTELMECAPDLEQFLIHYNPIEDEDMLQIWNSIAAYNITPEEYFCIAYYDTFTIAEDGKCVLAASDPIARRSVLKNIGLTLVIILLVCLYVRIGYSTFSYMTK